MLSLSPSSHLTLLHVCPVVSFVVTPPFCQQCDMTILTTAANIPSTSSPSPVSSSSSSTESNSTLSSPSFVSGMVSVHSAPLFISNQHLMHFKQQQQQISSSEFSSSSLLKMSNNSSSEKTPVASSATKPKIGFSIDSIVGTATSRSSPSPSSLDRSRSTSPADGHNGPANESGFHSVSPRPGSSGTPVSVRSEPDQPPHLPVSQQQQQSLPSPHPQMPLPPGWPTNVPPPHPQMNPAYFEALANMRALYAQQPPFQPHMMLPGPPPPPGAANQHWWLLAQARQQQQRLLAAAAAQRFPAGKFLISSLAHDDADDIHFVPTCSKLNYFLLLTIRSCRFGRFPPVAVPQA